MSIKQDFHLKPSFINLIKFVVFCQFFQFFWRNFRSKSSILCSVCKVPPLEFRFKSAINENKIYENGNLFFYFLFSLIIGFSRKKYVATFATYINIPFVRRSLSRMQFIIESQLCGFNGRHITMNKWTSYKWRQIKWFIRTSVKNVHMLHWR